MPHLLAAYSRRCRRPPACCAQMGGARTSVRHSKPLRPLQDTSPLQAVCQQAASPGRPSRQQPCRSAHLSSVLLAVLLAWQTACLRHARPSMQAKHSMSWLPNESTVMTAFCVTHLDSSPSRLTILLVRADGEGHFRFCIKEWLKHCLSDCKRQYQPAGHLVSQ